jgi:DNA-damage-inducible protein J
MCTHTRLGRNSTKLHWLLIFHAKAILAGLGMNFTDAVNIFVSMVVQTKGLPFEVKLPNAETLQAMKEADSGETLPVSTHG